MGLAGVSVRRATVVNHALGSRRVRQAFSGVEETRVHVGRVGVYAAAVLVLIS